LAHASQETIEKCCNLNQFKDLSARKELIASTSILAALALLTLAGCTAKHYRESADKAAYGTIRGKAPLVPNMDTNFTIEQPGAIVLGPFPVTTNFQEYLGPDGAHEKGAHILRLTDALELATHHSRAYQNRKEQLYLGALTLTFARHQFTPLFAGSAQAKMSGENQEGTTLVPVGTITHTTTNSITGDVSNSITQLFKQEPVFKENQKVTGAGSLSADWLIRDVGRLSAAFTADFLRFVTGDPRVTTSSQLSAQFVRPLIRDAGFKRQREALIQAERDLLYSLRTFAQYRKDFSVQVARDYYNVLGRRDAVRNSYLNLETSRKNAERMRALVAEGRSTTAELGRLEQQALNTESSWINAIRSYQQALDDFKISMGLPVESKILLDDTELAALQIEHPDLSIEDSIRIALTGRLDFQNVHDALEDADRQTDLARNLLKPQLDFSANVSIASDPNRTYSLPDPQRYRWDAGLALDPGIDRTSERNSYRSALIARNRAARDVEQLEDEIKLQVRESWRTLDQAKRNYEISEISVKLAERRVEEQELLAEVGRARAQDQVDAQNDLISSKNQRTQALVTHTIARLQFWNNMGILTIKDNGQWEEVRHDQTTK
jgi:outer membrane protein TolC